MLAFVGAALADFSPLLLYLFKYGSFDDRLVDILEDDPILTVILQPLFVLVGFRIFRMSLMVVVLPEPFGPISPIIYPFGKVKLIL